MDDQCHQVKAPTFRPEPASELWPIIDRFPGLDSLPRVEIRRQVTPVERLDRYGIWIKRDDLNAATYGGNKVRSLEWLLAGVRRGDRVATVGARGSTHALATAMHAGSLGASAIVGTWPQEMNAVARRVAERIGVTTTERQFASAAIAIPWLWWRAARGDRAIPAGGTSPLGMLGHVNAALELMGQIERGELPLPRRLVVALGTGGTMAGLALGCAVAGLDVEIIGVRVVPRVVGRMARVVRLAAATRRLIERRAGVRIPSDLPRLRVVHEGYGGAYGRALPRSLRHAEDLSKDSNIELDPTYTAKAFTIAAELERDESTLFWQTFDARWLRE